MSRIDFIYYIYNLFFTYILIIIKRKWYNDIKYEMEIFFREELGFNAFVCSFLAFPILAKADVAGLTPCGESKEFARRLDGSVKKLQDYVKLNMKQVLLQL